MGIILPEYRNSIVDNLIEDISANNTQYYVIASNPTTWSPTPTTTQDDYSAQFQMGWYLLFGKKLTINNIMPVINNVTWTTNTVYEQYSNFTDSLNSNIAPFYVATQPVLNGPWNIYKCIWNNFGEPSTQVPDLPQARTFQKSDGYLWRYITTITNADYVKFGSNSYIPIYGNTTIQNGAYENSGVDVVIITNGGSGYSATTNGVVQSVVNSTCIQVQSNASPYNDIYTSSGIYLENQFSTTSQLKYIKKYVSNTSGNWVFLDSPANTQNIINQNTQYLITPRVIFQCDGNSSPQAYTDVSNNGVVAVVMVDSGSYITWANVSIVANSLYGSGAAAYALTAPPGGHGSNPASELFVQGVAINFNFANTESNTIPVNLNYNRVGIIRNPYVLQSDLTKGIPYTAPTFSQLLVGTVSPAVTFPVGTYVTGQTSNSLGVVAFSNTSVIWLTGDQTFINNEFITNGSNTTQLTINNHGAIFTADMRPLYVQNLSNVQRANNQTEAFQLVIAL